MPPLTLSTLTEQTLAARLAEVSGSIHPTHAPLAPPFPAGFLSGKPRPAAVLVPFAHIEGEWHLLFTRRTDWLVQHSGQVAFPGGRADPDDPSPEATALREADEEIGLPAEDVLLLGRLDTFITITNYLLTPVVGCITWPFELRLEKEEVVRAFTIPLAWLLDPANHEYRPRTMPKPHPPIPVIYFKPYDGETLWGISAQITVRLLELLFGIKD